MCCWFASERCIWFFHDAQIFTSDLCVFSFFFWVGSGMLRFVAIYVWKCRALLTLLACHHRRRQNSQFCTTSVGLSNLQGAKNCSSQVLQSFFSGLVNSGLLVPFFAPHSSLQLTFIVSWCLCSPLSFQDDTTPGTTKRWKNNFAPSTGWKAWFWFESKNFWGSFEPDQNAIIFVIIFAVGLLE